MYAIMSLSVKSYMISLSVSEAETSYSSNVSLANKDAASALVA